MILVIVESGTKAAVIEKYLKDSKKLSNIKNEFGQFKVIASKGHVRDLAKKELSNFKIVQGLSQDTFNLYIALFLKQTKIVQEIDEFIEVPRRFGEVKKFLGNLFDKKNIDVDIAHTWQTLMRWLLYFLPNRYSCKVFNYSEIFYRIQK